MIECRQTRKIFQQNIFVRRFSQIEKLLFTSMRTRTDCQIDFLLFKILQTDRLLLFKIDFYCSRFYRQINLSSLHLTQVTFEDLPWFTLSINRQTSKTEDRFKFQVKKLQVQILSFHSNRSKIALSLRKTLQFSLSPKDFCTLPQKDFCTLLSFCNLVTLRTALIFKACKKDSLFSSIIKDRSIFK